MTNEVVLYSMSEGNMDIHVVGEPAIKPVLETGNRPDVQRSDPDVVALRKGKGDSVFRRMARPFRKMFGVKVEQLEEGRAASLGHQEQNDPAQEASNYFILTPETEEKLRAFQIETKTENGVEVVTAADIVKRLGEKLSNSKEINFSDNDSLKDVLLIVKLGEKYKDLPEGEELQKLLLTDVVSQGDQLKGEAAEQFFENMSVNIANNKDITENIAGFGQMMGLKGEDLNGLDTMVYSALSILQPVSGGLGGGGTHPAPLPGGAGGGVPPVRPAPATGGGVVPPHADQTKPHAADDEGKIKKDKLKWLYRSGTILGLLILLYFYALWKAGRGIEGLSERTRAGASRL